MRAVLCRRLEGPGGLAVEDVPRPDPGPDQVRVRVRAAGVNFADTLLVTGRYQVRPELPFTPGMEIAGEVVALGPGVRGIELGERVMATLPYGGFAEEVVARTVDVVRVPEGVGDVAAAGLAVAYGTAHGALLWAARLRVGETLAVHGAAGGVGLAAVECGKALGARVIATARGRERLEVARSHGADELIDYRTEDIRERVKALTAGRGADVVFDPVGGDVFDASLRCVAWGGRLIVVGFAAGRVPQIPANILLVKNVSAMGFYWGSYRSHAPELVIAQFADLFAWLRQGRLRPHVSHALDLARAGEALALLAGRKSTGKVVLTTAEG